MMHQKIAQSLKSLEWGTLLLELFLLVLGVIIGIEVSQWTDAKAEKQQEAYYLERLHEDFILSVETIEEGIVFMENQIDTEKRVLDQLERCERDGLSEADFAAELYSIGKVWPPALVRDTLDELLATGKFYTVHDGELRRALTELLREEAGDDKVLEYIVQRMTPHVVYIDSKAVIPTDHLGEADIQGSRTEFNTLCADATFHASLSRVQNLTQEVLVNDRELMEHYKNILHLIVTQQALIR